MVTKKASKILAVALSAVALSFAAIAVYGCGGGGDDGGGGDCSYYWSLFKCNQTVNGIKYVGGLVPSTCGCPSGTRYAGMDNVSAGAPWKMCTCN